VGRSIKMNTNGYFIWIVYEKCGSFAGMETLIRINKRMAELGMCSRREADALLAEGIVKVNGKIAKIGQSVSESDEITIGRNISHNKVYLAYYKGRGIISHSPDTSEVDISTRLMKDYGLTGVYPIGRLDKDSEGLMILTNDGRITAPLLDSKNKIEKEYEVTVDKPVSNRLLKSMAAGVNIEGYLTKEANTKQKSLHSFYLTLTEGKKHQIRRMCAALGYQVESLKRIRIAHVELDKLKPNQYRKLNKEETAKLIGMIKV